MKKKGPLFLSRRGFENLLVVVVGVLLYLCFTHMSAVVSRVNTFVSVLRPFIVGFVLAYLLNRPVVFFENKVFYKSKGRRSLAILVVYVITLVVLAGLMGMVVPQLVQSLVGIANNAAVYVKNISDFASYLQEEFNLDPTLIEPFRASSTDLIEWLSDFLTDAMPQIVNISVSVGSGLISVLTALIASVYMLSGKNTLLRQFRKLVYAFVPRERAARFLGICAHANDIFSGFIIGKIIDSAIIGVICLVGMNLLRMPYAMLISVIVGVTNVIPFFGPFIGAIPSILILFMVSPFNAVKFAIFVLALQQFDGNILGPKILGNSTGLSAIWVLVAIIVGGGLFGFTGMLLGVPTFAVFYALISELIARRLREKGLDGSGNLLAEVEENAVMQPKEEATEP